MFTASIDSLSNDLFQDFISEYFGISERLMDTSCFPVTLQSLMLVNKRFRNAVVNTKSKTFLTLEHFRNTPMEMKKNLANRVMNETCRAFGSVTFISWLSKTLNYPLESHFAGAAFQGKPS